MTFGLGRKKAVAYLCVIILESFLVFYILIIAYDYPMTIFNINPPRKKIVIPISLIYPDSFVLTSGGLGESGFYLSYNLEANGTIAEGTNVAITNPIGKIVSDNYREIVAVLSGFDETVPFNTPITEGGHIIGGNLSSVVIFTHSSNDANLNPHEMKIVFKWLVSGDFSPRIQICFRNGTIQEHIYNEIKIHVASMLEMQDLKISKIELALTWALTVFGVLEGFAVAHDLIEGKLKSTHTESPSSEAQPQVHTPNKATQNDMKWFQPVPR